MNCGPSPSVSVIIPCYNAELYIRQTISSIEGWESGNVEIIAVDDGSTDSTASIISTEFPYVHLVQIRRGGVSAARNLGTQLSSAPFLQYLDADDVLAPGKLERQIEALRVTGADIAYGDWRRLVRRRDGEYEPGRVVSRKLIDPEIDLFLGTWCPPAAYLVRRTIAERTGGFRVDLPIVQDARFILDCALHGAIFVRVEGLLAFYRVHSSGSLSTKDPIEYLRDCLRNSASVEKWWEEHGGITDKRRVALLKAFGLVARASFRREPQMFEEAVTRLERLQPHYIPVEPALLALTARFVGYRRAEHLAYWYRRAKRISPHA